MNKYLKESFLWALILSPYIYLWTIWNRLPDRVPTHFNMTGNPDNLSGKNSLLILPAALGIGLYLFLHYLLTTSMLLLLRFGECYH